MYCEFYQMTERPFNVTPDPKCLYLNARYREALAALQYGIGQRKGFITLIGEAGTGKTTLLKRLLDEFDEKTRSVFIFNTHVSFEEILEYVFAEFDLPVHNGKKLYMIQRLNTFLLEELRTGGNVALLIDEAQDLEYSVLEDLRLLSNLETAKEKIRQIVLSGQPELGDKLSNPVLRQLRQRIAVSCRLLPLSRDEVSEYIQYRLHAAGCSDLKLFTRDAEDQIYHFSRGIPRLINVVCDNALVIGYALGKKRISGDVIAEAAADLMPVQEQETETIKESAPVSVVVPVSPGSRDRARLGLIAVVAIALVIGVLSMGRTMLQRSTVSETTVREQPQTSAVVVRPLEVMRPNSMPAAREGEPGGNANTVPALPAVVDAAPAPPPPVAEGAPIVDSSGVASASGGLPDPPAVPPDQARAERAQVADPVQVAAPEVVSPAAALEQLDPPAPDPEARTAEPPDPAPNPLWADAEVANAPALGFPTTSERAAAVPSTDTVKATEPMRLAANSFDQVVVQSGDSISRIALRKYGQASQTILDLLKLANPELQDINRISIGQKINLPDLSESSVLSYGDRRFGVLVYSTSQPGRAAALDAALRARGQRSRVSQGILGRQQPIYRVVLEGFGDRASAASASKEVQRMFREDSRMAVLVR
jgi:general secretion pathway protein A